MESKSVVLVSRELRKGCSSWWGDTGEHFEILERTRRDAKKKRVPNSPFVVKVSNRSKRGGVWEPNTQHLWIRPKGTGMRVKKKQNNIIIEIPSAKRRWDTDWGEDDNPY